MNVRHSICGLLFTAILAWSGTATLAQAPETLDENQLLEQLTSSPLGDFRNYRDAFWQMAEPPRAGRIYLDELEPVAVSSASGVIGRFGRHPIDIRAPQIIDRRFHPAIGKTHFTFLNTVTELGLLFQGNSFAEYRLGGGFQYFRTTVAKYAKPYDKLPPGVPLTFRVWGDGTMLWESPPVETESDYEECYVDIQGIDLLRLEVCYVGQQAEPPTDFEAVWATPFVSSQPAPDVVRDLFDPVKFARRSEYVRLMAQLDRAMAQQDYPALEKIIRETRLNPDFLHSLPKLYHIYTRFAQGNVQSDYQWLQNMEVLQQWQAAFPETPSPTIALIGTKIEYVTGQQRLMDDSNGHSDQRSKLIVEQQLREIHELIDSMRAQGIDEPHLALQELNLAKLERKPNEVVIDLLNAAIDRFPDYWPIYDEGVIYLDMLNPNNPEQISKVAGQLRERLGGIPGEELYARMAVACLRYRHKQPVADCGFDPQLLGVGLWHIALNHCENETMMHHVCQQACIVGEDELAAALMQRLNGCVLRSDIWQDGQARMRFRRKYDPFWNAMNPHNVAHALYQRSPGPGDNSVRLTFTPDGTQLIASGTGLVTWNGEETTSVFEIARRNPLFTNRHALSHDGKLIASNSPERRASIYDAKTHQLLRPIGEQPFSALLLEFSPDDKELAIAVDSHTIDFRDPQTGASLRTMKVHEGNGNGIRDLAYSADGKLLATCGNDKLIHLYDTATLQPLAELRGHYGNVVRVVFSPHNDVLASASTDGTIKIWDLTTKRERLTYFGHSLIMRTNYPHLDSRKHYSSEEGTLGIAFSPQHRLIFTSDCDGEIQAWDYLSGIRRAVFTDFKGVATGLDVSPNGENLGVSTRVGFTTYDLTWLDAGQRQAYDNTFGLRTPPPVYFPPVVQSPHMKFETPIQWTIARLGNPVYREGDLRYAILPDDMRHCSATLLPAVGGTLKFELTQPAHMRLAVTNHEQAKPLRDQLESAGWKQVSKLRLHENGGVVPSLWLVFERDCVAGEAFNFAAGDFASPVLFGKRPMYVAPGLWPAEVLAREQRMMRAGNREWKQQFELQSEQPVDVATTAIRVKSFTKNGATKGQLMLSWPGQDWIAAANWDGGLRQSIDRFGGWHEFTLSNLPESAATDRLTVKLIPQGVRNGGPVEVAEVAWVKRSGPESQWREWTAPASADPRKVVEYSPQHRLAIDLKYSAPFVAYSPTQDRFASAQFDFSFREWDPQTGKELHSYRNTNRVYDLQYSPTGDRLMISEFSGNMEIFAVGKQQVGFIDPSHKMQAAWAGLFTPDGNKVVAAGWGISLRQLKEDNARAGDILVDVPGGPRYIHAAAFDPTGRFLFTGDDQGGLAKWDLQEKKVVQTYPGHTGRCKALCVSADGSKLYSASPRDPLVRIWDVATGKQIGVLEGHTTGAGSLALMPDGKHLISGSCWLTVLGDFELVSPEHCIRIWNLQTQQQVAQLDGQTTLVTDLALSGDGKTLVSASLDNKIHVWDLSTLKLGQ